MKIIRPVTITDAMLLSSTALETGQSELINRAGCQIVGRTVTKTAASAAWDASVVSAESFTGSAYVSFQSGQSNKNLMFGLNSDPASDDSYASIDYAMFATNYGALAAMENGIMQGLGVNYVPDDILQVIYAGTTVSYYKNGNVLRTVTGLAPNLTFALDSCLLEPGATANNVTFGAPASEGLPWSSSTVYPLGATVRLAATHRRYQSLVAGNIGYPPDASPDRWQDIGPTNPWAMFDRSVGSLTRKIGALAVALAPGAADALAVVDTDAELVRVVMTNGATTVYDSTKTTEIGGFAVTDWYLYFFEPIGTVTALTFLDLPSYPDATITVTLTGADPAGAVSCGTLIVGRQMDLGSTEAGAGVGITDFSRKATDDFGVTSVVERAWAKRMTVRTLIDTASVDPIQRTLAGLRATPVLWLGEEGFDSLTVYGFYKDFSLDLAYSNVSYCSLTIEGLT